MQFALSAYVARISENSIKSVVAICCATVVFPLYARTDFEIVLHDGFRIDVESLLMRQHNSVACNFAAFCRKHFTETMRRVSDFYDASLALRQAAIESRFKLRLNSVKFLYKFEALSCSFLSNPFLKTCLNKLQTVYLLFSQRLPLSLNPLVF